MWRRCFLLLAACALALGAMPSPASATDVYVFWQAGCPHCERELAFLGALAEAEPRIRVHAFDIRGAEGRGLFKTVVQALRPQEVAVPFTVIGGRVFVGFQDADTSGAALRAQALACLRQPCPDPVAPLLGPRQQSAAAASAPLPAAPLPARLRLPLLGEIQTRDLSLPALTVVLAAVDGFNPCAMWVLVFLIGLLLGMRDRLRMWLLGTAFIAASAGIYLTFMAAWLNLVLFLGAIVWVRAALALVALGAGAWNLRRFFMDGEAACRVTAPAARRRVFERLRAIALERRFLLALGAIVMLAFAVNLVELLCSLGIPAVYTQVLALSDLPAWRYALYLLLYVFVFMLDDLLVFVGAMKTLQIAGLGTRYVRASHLIGGIALIGVGIALLLRPQWLTLGSA